MFAFVLEIGGQFFELIKNAFAEAYNNITYTRRIDICLKKGLIRGKRQKMNFKEVFQIQKKLHFLRSPSHSSQLTILSLLFLNRSPSVPAGPASNIARKFQCEQAPDVTAAKPTCTCLSELPSASIKTLKTLHPFEIH